MRRAAKKDANHNDIAEHLKSCGWSVLDMSRLGAGCPDMAVARRGFTAMVEVKRDGKRDARERLNPCQQRFFVGWSGVVIAAKSPKDAEMQLDLAEKYQYLRCAGFQA